MQIGPLLNFTGAGDPAGSVGDCGDGDQEVSNGSVPQVPREAWRTLQASWQLHQGSTGNVGVNEGLP